MSQIDQFLSALKRALKAKNILYKDLAKILNLSESSVKRILSSKSLTLERLEEVCRATDISFADIIRLAEFDDESYFKTMTEDQERILAESPRLMHYFMLLHEGITPSRILKDYQIDAEEAHKFLFQLDRMNIIELHPNDRVRLKHIGRLKFKKDGPMGKKLFAQTKQAYLEHDFNGSADYVRFNLANLSPSTIQRFKSKLEKLSAEIVEEGRFEPGTQKGLTEVGIMFAIRPWRYSYMNSIPKKKP